MNKNSILSVSDLSISTITQILNDSKNFSRDFKDWQLSSNRLIANLFFEPSTRTHFSFVSAEHQLGVKVADFNPDTSSVVKGESLYDTVKTFEAIGYDAVVIRHPRDNYFEELYNIKIPIINAGDGTGNHPSQTLLDLYTIYEHFSGFEGLNVMIVGDIKHSRVANSNLSALTRLGAKVTFSGPDIYANHSENYIDFDEGIKNSDVVMMLRIQHERHQEKMNISKQEYLEKFGLTMKRVNAMKENAIIMHPAPVNRGVEIEDEVVEHSKSKIFKQMENGVYVRKAMIKYIFDESFGIKHDFNKKCKAS